MIEPAEPRAGGGIRRSTIERVTSDPLQDLRAAVETAASALHSGDGGGRPNLDRPPKPDLGDYSTNAAMLLAPARRRAAARDRGASSGRELESELGGQPSASRSPGPGFLNLFLADAWYRERRRADARRRRRLRAPGAGRGRAGAGRVRLAPTRPGPLHVGQRPAAPPTATRSPACSSSPATPSSASTTSTTPAARCGSSRSRSRRGCAARSRPRTATRASTSPSWPSELAEAGPDPTTSRTLGAARHRAAMRERIEATLERFGVRFDRWFSERSLHESGKVEEALEALRRRATSTSSEGASGCGPPTSATTRTGC